MLLQATSNATRKVQGCARVALAGFFFAAALAAQAKNPWESIADMIKARNAQVPTSATAATGAQSASLALPAKAAGMIPMLREVPDEAGMTSASQSRLQGSAASALATMKLAPATSATQQQRLMAGAPDKPGKVMEVGLESEENESLLATDLFKKPDIRRLLGDEPRFIYNPAQRPDPMVAPWVRRAAIFKELAAAADAWTVQGNFDRAVEVYQRILQLNDPRFSEIVQAKLTAIAEKQNAAAMARAQAQQALQVAEEKIELPAWVHDNTTGVIISPGHDMCLVGEFMLRRGDAVPNYPDVRIASIAPSRVVYQIRNKTFEVVLNAN